MAMALHSASRYRSGRFFSNPCWINSPLPVSTFWKSVSATTAYFFTRMDSLSPI